MVPYGTYLQSSAAPPPRGHLVAFCCRDEIGCRFNVMVWFDFAFYWWLMGMDCIIGCASVNIPCCWVDDSNATERYAASVFSVGGDGD